MLIPFLGSALSRAREYTCDRYGAAGAGDREGALFGLTVLAAGGRLARKVDRRAFVAQRAQLDTGLMMLGEWFSTHPPLAKRLVQIDPSLGPELSHRKSTLRAVAIIGGVVAPLLLAGVAGAVMLPKLTATAAQQARHTEHTPPPRDVADRQVREDFQRLAAFLETELKAGRDLPWDGSELYDRWRTGQPGQAEPRDPYDGMPYGYEQRGEQFRIWSAGPDGDRHQALIYDSRRPSTE